MLLDLGVEYAFGIFGGAIATFCKALSGAPIRIVHFRHEAGAAFAAIEASLASGRPVVVFCTTGPGVTNMLTGMTAARWEGAKVIFVSGCTSAAQRGRWAFQETNGYSSSLTGLFSEGTLIHYGSVIEDPAELRVAAARLASGLARPGGFVAHIGLPISIQSASVGGGYGVRLSSMPPTVSDAKTIATCVDLLSESPYVIWAGFGAREAAPLVLALAEKSGAPVMCSPRAKGVVPEDHPLYLGVTGLGGHSSVGRFMKHCKPARVLVLGSRLGEFTSFWSPDLAPREGFIHVDVDPTVFGTAYPSVETFGIQEDVGRFLEAVLAAWPKDVRHLESVPFALPGPEMLEHGSDGPVRPSFLMHAIQRTIVDESDAIIMTEAGNAFGLGSHHLRFKAPKRYRVSTGFGSMGHASAGVIGAALASGVKGIAILGDGAMMMLNEINTAVALSANVAWIVLNDARYGMIAQGMSSLGWTPFHTDFPRADFCALARSLGADGIRIEREADVCGALRAAMHARGPFVVDVLIDPSERAPTGHRNESLAKQGVVVSERDQGT